jgi:hypothetical protein
MAERLMRAQFGNVKTAQHSAILRIIDLEDALLALTSHLPGGMVTESQQRAFQDQSVGSCKAGRGDRARGAETLRH